MTLHRTYTVTKWPREIEPAWLQQMLAHRGLADISLHVTPIPEDEAGESLEKLIEAYYSTTLLGKHGIGITVSLDDAILAAREVVKGAARLHHVGLYVTVHGQTPAELEAECDAIIRRARKLMLRLAPATFRQMPGRWTTLPLGLDLLQARRRFTSDAVASIVPFASGSFTGHPDTGILLGTVIATGAPAFWDRFALPNHNTLILASSGAGKSFGAKLQLGWERERDTEVLILDYEGEYERLAEVLGGRVIHARGAGDVATSGPGLECYSLRRAGLNVPPEQEDNEIARIAGEVLSALWVRIRRTRGRRKLLALDEGFLALVGNTSAARPVWSLAKRSRRFEAGLMLITQDVDDVLATDLGASIVQNSATKILLRQDPNALAKLTEAFRLSEGERQFLVAAPQGDALLIAGDERAAIRIEATSYELPYCRSTPPGEPEDVEDIQDVEHAQLTPA